MDDQIRAVNARPLCPSCEKPMLLRDNAPNRLTGMGEEPQVFRFYYVCPDEACLARQTGTWDTDYMPGEEKQLCQRYGCNV